MPVTIHLLEPVLSLFSVFSLLLAVKEKAFLFYFKGTFLDPALVSSVILAKHEFKPNNG
jgi:hypothetical protein